MDNFKNMSVKIKTVAKQLPKYSRSTAEIIPFLDAWLVGQDERFIRKVKKIFEGAAVDKRYSIMDPIEVFTKTSFEVAEEPLLNFPRLLSSHRNFFGFRNFFKVEFLALL